MKMSSDIDALLQRAITLGAEKTKLIDTDSIIVEKWVKWKCIYGCPLFGKDGIIHQTHPTSMRPKR